MVARESASRRITVQRFGLAVVVLIGWASWRAQAQLPERIEPSSSLNLDQCVELGLQNQPALAAAQASLDAAQAGLQGVQKLRLAALLSKEMPMRRQQACWGVVIAAAGLQQAEWETRYAVTRNYFSVIYARDQQRVLTSVIDKLDGHLDSVRRMLKTKTKKVTINDQYNLEIQIAFFKSRQVEADVGIERAHAALREAIGVGLEFPLLVNPNARLPDPVYDLDKGELIALSLHRRGELVQAASAHNVTQLEIMAQERHKGIKAQTFAAGGDVHARPIPVGVYNKEYLPGAIGLEMPAYLPGRKPDRVQRAQAFHERAGAVIDKTQNLITLEVEASYFKWKEAVNRLRILANTKGLTEKIAARVTEQFNDQQATGEELLRARTLEDKARAQYNEALYNHALGLAALERVTAGGYRPSYAAKRKPD